MYRDLINLRLNRGGKTRGLSGQHVRIIRADENAKVICFSRWMEGGAGDEVVVMANFHREARNDFRFGFPSVGAWELQFNSDWKGYSSLFGNHPSAGAIAHEGECDGLPSHAAVSIGPYSVLVFARTSS